MLANVITSHSKFQLNCSKRFRDMNLQKLAKFFFLLFVTVWKLPWNTKAFSNCLEIWYTERWDNGASRYQISLQHHKWLQSYKWLLAKNNTNMLSHLQGKPLMARSWKSAKRQGNYWTSNLFVIERPVTTAHTRMIFRVVPRVFTIMVHTKLKPWSTITSG